MFLCVCVCVRLMCACACGVSIIMRLLCMFVRVFTYIYFTCLHNNGEAETPFFMVGLRLYRDHRHLAMVRGGEMRRGGGGRGHV